MNSDAEQRNHRADRELDAAGDDDEGLTDRENAEQADLIGGVGDVIGQQEARIDDDDGADDQDQDEQARSFCPIMR